MKIILLYPNWTGEYGGGMLSRSAKKYGGSVPPLHLAYLAAVAENLGHEVRIIDGEAENLSLEEMIEETMEFQPGLIGITASSPFFHLASNLAKGLKKRIREVPIAIGGPHITILKEKAFYPWFDYAFIGESEQSLPQFLDQYEKSKDVSMVKGILFRRNGRVVFTGQADPIFDIDSLPLPARHLLKMDKYKIGTSQGIKNFTSIMTTRGCPFQCIFCSTKVFGRGIRKHSPELVVKEMKSVKDKYNIKHFYFLDDNLTLDKNHILNICDLIEKEKLEITFQGSTRANLIDEEIISKMAKAGLIRLSFGLESVDKNIRKIMRKEVPLESYITANKLTNKYGIETLNSCIIGLPGETTDTIKKTLSFLRDSHDIKQANISIAVPYPGTELYEMAKRGEHGLKLLIDDFSKFRRYNSAVMQVGDLSPQDLIKLQNDAFASVYLAPWRWRTLYKRSGIMGVFYTFTRLIKSIARGRFELLTVDRNYWKQGNNSEGTDKDLLISQIIKNSIETKRKILENRDVLDIIGKVIQEMIKAFRNNKKVLFCGNGGSAADAQHLAAELSGKFYLNREPLFAEALHVNSSYLTAVANDFSFDQVFARLVKAKGKEGDILIGISTSGNSSNVIKAIEMANNLKMITVGLTGGNGGKMKDLCQYLIKVSSNDAPRIQESHILIGHIICEIVEKSIFGD